MTLPPIHPSGDIWPLLSDEQLDLLAEDLTQHGQVLPIVFVDGLLLDGRNRWLACERAGIEPWTSEIETDDPDALAWSLNEHRRHAPDGVRQLAAAKRANLDNGQRADLVQGLPIGRAAEMFGVSERSASRAKVVLDYGDPVIIGAVESGDLAVSLAEKTIRRIEQTGEPITSVSDIKRIMREAWREDHPLPEKPAISEPEPVHTHVSIDTFEIVHAIIRHASNHPPEEAAEQVDKWTRLNILDDLPPAIAYLRDLKAALDKGGE